MEGLCFCFNSSLQILFFLDISKWITYFICAAYENITNLYDFKYLKKCFESTLFCEEKNIFEFIHNYKKYIGPTNYFVAFRIPQMTTYNFPLIIIFPSKTNREVQQIDIIIFVDIDVFIVLFHFL